MSDVVFVDPEGVRARTSAVLREVDGIIDEDVPRVGSLHERSGTGVAAISGLGSAIGSFDSAVRLQLGFAAMSIDAVVEVARNADRIDG